MAAIDYKQALIDFEAYVSKHLGEENLIEQCIQVTYVSKYHFYRFFKAITGMSVNQYITERRLLKVMEKLMGEDKIIDIAMDWGFSSHEVMTRNFKKAFGITPSTFRKLSSDEQIATYEPKTKALNLDFTPLQLDIVHHQGNIDIQPDSIMSIMMSINAH